jgi:fatty-acyl-CoA synthase
MVRIFIFIASLEPRQAPLDLPADAHFAKGRAHRLRLGPLATPIIAVNMPLRPTATETLRLPPRCADFGAISEALDYAALGDSGFNFYSGKGELLVALTYRELAERARDMARRLVKLGVARGERMVLVADTDPDFMVAFFACQYAGILPVPVAIPTTLGGRVAYITQLRAQIDGSGALLAMAPQSLVPLVKEAAEGFDLVMVGGPDDYAQLPMAGANLRPLAGYEAGYLQYSSGSTRFPKGIEITQRAFCANAYAIARHGLRIQWQDRCASWLPLYHDMGLVGFMLVPMATQMSVDYIPTREFARRSLTWLKLISDNRCTLSYSPSFGYDLCSRRLREGSDLNLDLSCWRAAGIGGDMVQPQILERFAESFARYGFRHDAFVPSYGMAETTLAMSFAPLNRRLRVDYIYRAQLAERSLAVPGEPGPDTRGFVACGPALSGHEFEIRDSAGNRLGERQIGRIYFHGSSVMSGYFGLPDLTAEVIDAQGWLSTGDLGYLLDGEIVITGREKDLIIVNGRNIWPQDLEWSAEELPELRRGDAAAFSVEEPGVGESVVILVQCRSVDAAQRAEIARSVAAILQQAHGVEARVVLIPPHGLPQTSSGKISRTKAKALYLSGGYEQAKETEGA